MNDSSLSGMSAKGENTFSNRKLQGRSFKGQDLSGEDFSGSDIRGADFSNTILKQANFRNARAGLRLYKAAIVFILLFVATGLLGVLAGFVGATIGLHFHSDALEIPSKVLAMTVHVSFLAISLRKGITSGFSVFAIALALAFLAALLHPDAIPIAGAIALAIVIDFSVASVTIIASVVAIVAHSVVNVRIASIVAGAFAVAFAVTLQHTRTSVSAIAIASTVMILSAYVGWRTLRRRENIRSIGSTLFASWGTSFRGADLTGADFSQAQLKNTDFRRATLTNMRWTDVPVDWTANL